MNYEEKMRAWEREGAELAKEYIATRGCKVNFWDRLVEWQKREPKPYESLLSDKQSRGLYWRLDCPHDPRRARRRIVVGTLEAVVERLDGMKSGINPLSILREWLEEERKLAE